MADAIRSPEDVETHAKKVGKHPAEWDTAGQRWSGANEAARPYVAVSDTPRPRRPREVIAELLGCGVPLRGTVHQGIGGDDEAADSASKTFMGLSRGLVALTRQNRVVALHADVAVDLQLIPPECAARVHARDAAVAAGRSQDDALDEAVAQSAASCAISLADLRRWMSAMKTAQYQERVKVVRERNRITTKAAPGEEPHAVAADLLAQSLQNMFMREMLDLGQRRKEGQPPRLYYSIPLGGGGAHLNGAHGFAAPGFHVEPAAPNGAAHLLPPHSLGPAQALPFQHSHPMGPPQLGAFPPGVPVYAVLNPDGSVTHMSAVPEQPMHSIPQQPMNAMPPQPLHAAPHPAFPPQMAGGALQHVAGIVINQPLRGNESRAAARSGTQQSDAFGPSLMRGRDNSAAAPSAGYGVHPDFGGVPPQLWGPSGPGGVVPGLSQPTDGLAGPPHSLGAGASGSLELGMQGGGFQMTMGTHGSVPQMPPTSGAGGQAGWAPSAEASFRPMSAPLADGGVGVKRDREGDNENEGPQEWSLNGMRDGKAQRTADGFAERGESRPLHAPAPLPEQLFHQQQNLDHAGGQQLSLPPSLQLAAPVQSPHGLPHPHLEPVHWGHQPQQLFLGGMPPQLVQHPQQQPPPQRQPQRGAKGNKAQKSTSEAAPAGDDVEVQEIKAIYRPALEFPGLGRLELQERCWTLFAQSNPTAVRETQLNEAVQKHSVGVMQTKRREFFGQDGVRERLRDSGLVAAERIEALEEPSKTTAKRAANLRLKVDALGLPPRNPAAPHPATLLVQDALDCGLTALQPILLPPLAARLQLEGAPAEGMQPGPGRKKAKRRVKPNNNQAASKQRAEAPPEQPVP